VGWRAKRGMGDLKIRSMNQKEGLNMKLAFARPAKLLGEMKEGPQNNGRKGTCTSFP